MYDSYIDYLLINVIIINNISIIINDLYEIKQLNVLLSTEIKQIWYPVRLVFNDYIQLYLSIKIVNTVQIITQ